MVLAGLAAAGFLVPLGDEPEPAAASVFPNQLEPGMSYVAMAGRERSAFESTFAEPTGAVDVVVRTIEVEGGSTSVGVRVVSLVLPEKPEQGERARLFAVLEELVPFSDPERQRWDGREVWVHADDDVLSSSVVVVDDRRLVVAYGGLLAAERAVIELLDT